MEKDLMLISVRWKNMWVCINNNNNNCVACVCLLYTFSMASNSFDRYNDNDNEFTLLHLYTYDIHQFGCAALIECDRKMEKDWMAAWFDFENLHTKSFVNFEVLLTFCIIHPHILRMKRSRNSFFRGKWKHSMLYYIDSNVYRPNEVKWCIFISFLVQSK